MTKYDQREEGNYEVLIFVLDESYTHESGIC